MKNLYTLLCFLFFSISSMAQLTGITPNSGLNGQTLSTTITGNGIFIQSSSPSGNLYQINLIQGTNVMTLFDYNMFWNFWNVTVTDPNTVVADLAIPLAFPSGTYDLQVITGDVFWPNTNQNIYNLPGAFTITPPDGYITGTVYDDLNKNGVKDGGEPGVSGAVVNIAPLNYNISTDASGNYSMPVQNGTYNVAYSIYTGDYRFTTTADTLTPTVANNTAAGNDFGLKRTLLSVNPDFGYKGLTTLHQFIADEPIFTGIGTAGNVTQVAIFSSPSFYVSVASNVTVVDAYTVNISISIPVGTAVGNDFDVRIYTNSVYPGYHYLKQQFDILAPPSLISGHLFFDQNQNKINDPGEPAIQNGKVILTPDNSISFSDYYGNYSVASFGGVQTLSYGNNISGLTVFTDSLTYTFNATGIITGKDFGFISTYPDYSIDMKNMYLFARCNTAQNLHFNVRNNGNVTCDVNAWLKLDPQVNYFSSTPTPTSVSNDTIYWTIPSVLPYSEAVVSVYMGLPGAGAVLNFTGQCTSVDAGGNPQFTDTDARTFSVFCSYDPNDKQVDPPGILTENFVLMSDTLTYMIRFQNTGTDTAFKVVVLDTLDANLDYNTFDVIGSSHSVQTELKSNGAVKFTFNNIMLPDSNANEAGSHGYVRYTIRANAGLVDSTEIYNTGHIFFDFNPDVITNTTLNTFVFVLPVGIDEPGVDQTVLFYPNPFSHSAQLTFENPDFHKMSLTITDVTGKLVAPEMITTGNQFIIEKNKLTKGIYFYKMTNTGTNAIYAGKFIVE